MLPNTKSGVNTQQGPAQVVRWHRGWAGCSLTCSSAPQGSPTQQAVDVCSKLPVSLTNLTPASYRILCCDDFAYDIVPLR